MRTFLVAILIVFLFIQSYECDEKLDLKSLKQRVKNMFYHGYDNYMKFAYPYDELRPLTCDGHDTWGSFSLTLIDSLDTLVVLGNHTEFRKGVKLVLENIDTNLNVNVSVFETNIRSKKCTNSLTYCSCWRASFCTSVVKKSWLGCWTRLAMSRKVAWFSRTICK